MVRLTKLDPYGALIEPATVKIQRLLPSPIERRWDWITESDLPRQWLASGVMDLTEGVPFELPGAMTRSPVRRYRALKASAPNTA